MLRHTQTKPELPAAACKEGAERERAGAYRAAGGVSRAVGEVEGKDVGFSYKNRGGGEGRVLERVKGRKGKHTVEGKDRREE